MPALPDKTLKISIPYLVAIVSLLVSLSIGYGSYKVRFEEDHQQRVAQAESIKALTIELAALRLELVKLEVRFEAMQPRSYAPEQTFNLGTRTPTPNQ